ncbi:hypothetical protein GCM10010430_17770 [Kitasatospora cystarginea]|uniref:Secreted protein n=1 Tax=Kitasatospora cystarginea TaxID=58350 RepID=A0ABN3DN88_9ACTN
MASSAAVALALAVEARGAAWAAVRVASPVHAVRTAATLAMRAFRARGIDMGPSPGAWGGIRVLPVNLLNKT